MSDRPAAARPRTSARTGRFTESVVREMTRLILHHQGDRGVNLAQGFPDFPCPPELKEAAKAAIDADQRPDGGWIFNWRAWNDATTLEWRALVTVRALHTLAAYGRLPLQP